MKTATSVQCWSCHRALAEMEIGSKLVCWTCYKGLKQYNVCSSCGKTLNAELADFALRHHMPVTCGKKACKRQADIKSGYLCCEKSKYIDCVCTRATKCPVHGERHVGTHD